MSDAKPTAGAPFELAIDLRTDEITQPTEEMWEAMRKADVGWAKVGENASVNTLEPFAAELAGKEAAVYVPTGSMANLVALMTHTRKGDQIIH
jgi:threonine aldolase